jgi:CheY-like chemotaxis protein
MIIEPTVSIESPATSTQWAEWHERQQARKRLLLADDQPSIRDSLSRLLRRQGYNVILAENGREAVERVAGERFDLVLLDLSMPEMNGWEALKRIAALKPGLPVVIMTAHSHQRPWVEPTGAWSLLEKPIDIPLLLSTIQELTARFKHYPPTKANGFPGLLAKSGINE